MPFVMNARMASFFIFSVAVILFVTGIAKVYSATGSAEALSKLDPILSISNRQVFYSAGIAELLISAFLLMKAGEREIKLLIIAWLALIYLTYRIFSLWLGVPGLCDCLGNLNDRLFISPLVISRFIFASLIWMIIGSSFLLCREWVGHSKFPRPEAFQESEKETA